MATHGGNDIEEARSQAIIEIDRTTQDILEIVEMPMKAGAKYGGQGAWDAAERGKYIKTLQTNAASFKAQAEAFAAAGQLGELRNITEGELVSHQRGGVGSICWIRYLSLRLHIGGLDTSATARYFAHCSKKRRYLGASRLVESNITTANGWVNRLGLREDVVKLRA